MQREVATNPSVYLLAPDFPKQHILAKHKSRACRDLLPGKMDELRQPLRLFGDDVKVGETRRRRLVRRCSAAGLGPSRARARRRPCACRAVQQLLAARDDLHVDTNGVAQPRAHKLQHLLRLRRAEKAGATAHSKRHTWDG
eukprot:5699103-Pleurochrysis_carterae.AAC.1